MTSRKRFFVLSVLLSALLCANSAIAEKTLGTASTTSNAKFASWVELTDYNFATNATYLKLAQGNDAEFAWRLFVRMNRPSNPAPSGTASNTIPRNWEIWPTNSQAFPASDAPLAWDTAINQVSPKEFNHPALLDLKTGNAAGVTTTAEVGANNEESKLNLGAVVEEVRRNKDSYEHIRTKGYFCADIIVGDKNIKFPKGSVEIKAEWRPKQSTDKKGELYTATYNKKTYVLIGMHITSKALPKWFWATWEHKSNPLRGKLFTSQTDSYGFTNDTTPTAALKALLKDGGMDTSLWTHYRLVNWQNGYNSPTVAGNSVIEGPLTPNSSSCITCHAIASAGKVGKKGPGNLLYPTPEKDLKTKVTHTFTGVIPVGKTTATSVELDFAQTGPVGTPTTTTLSGTDISGYSKFDFVWSLFRAQQDNTAACQKISKKTGQKVSRKAAQKTGKQADKTTGDAF